MSEVISHLTVRAKAPAIELIWYDGRNAIEVAEFLQGHGKRAHVEFHNFGRTLSIDGYRVDADREDGGIWVAQDGRKFTKKIIDDNYVIVKR